MNNIQKQVLIRVLDLASEYFGERHDKSFQLENTPDNMELANEVLKTQSDQKEPYIIKGKICLMDWMLANYFAQLLEKELVENE